MAEGEKQKKGDELVRKKILAVALSAILAIGTLSGCQSAVQEKKKGTFTILTSFYPMYILALNLVDGAENVELRNLASPSTGCLHDYQMRPMDMVNMEQNDVMIINGAGMEEFLEDATKGLDSLTLIDATEGLNLLPSEEHSHGHEDHDHDHEDHDHEDHDHGEWNAHAWLSLDLYEEQIEAVANQLSQYNPENKEIYQKNAKEYKNKIEHLKGLEEEIKEETKGKKIVIFHEAFAYMAQDLGMEVVESLEVETDAGLSAGQIKELIDEVDHSGADLLISEKQYSGKIGQTLEKEIGIHDITLDSCVTGKMEKNSYLNSMEENLRVLKEALSNGA